MKIGIFSIHDKLIGYKSPFVDHSDEVAVRNFSHSVELESDSSSNCPILDLSLYKVGIFDTKTGVIESFSSPEFLTSGVLVLNSLDK